MPLLNRFEVTVTENNGEGAEVKSHVLDYDLREGFDASTTDDLDTQVKSLPYLEPLPFGDSSATFSTELILPAEWLSGLDESHQIAVAALDIYGNTLTTQFAIVPEPAYAALLLAIGAALALRRRR
jgi:hypothetical protein